MLCCEYSMTIIFKIVIISITLRINLIIRMMKSILLTMMIIIIIIILIIIISIIMTQLFKSNLSIVLIFCINFSFIFYRLSWTFIMFSYWSIRGVNSKKTSWKKTPKTFAKMAFLVVVFRNWIKQFMFGLKKLNNIEMNNKIILSYLRFSRSDVFTDINKVLTAV